MNLETDRSIDDLSQEAIVATKQLINNAEKVRTNRDSSNRKMFRRMLRENSAIGIVIALSCLLYTSPSPRDGLLSRMPSSA